MDLEKRYYYINLFDLYKNLFTTKQIEYFSYYYLEDYSLKEISDMFNISRNAIFDQIKKVVTALENYELKLGIYKKNIKLREALEKNLSKEKILEIIEG